jgi:enoyl-CoA hydratase/carnithine racemase
MSLISIEIDDTTAFIKLNREITNAINLQMVDELSSALQDLGSNDGVHSLVFTSENEKFFSIGLDIPQLYDLPRQEFVHFFHTFNQVCIDLLAFPKPTIAAITGHAIAGGCILTLCCDYRLIAAGHKLMGLNEVKLGVPVPFPAACLLPHIVGDRNAREMMYTGDFYSPKQAYGMGLVDEVVQIEQVRSRSIEKAKALSAGSAQAITQIKRGHIERIKTQIEKLLEESEVNFINRWYADDTRKNLKEAMDKF